MATIENEIVFRRAVGYGFRTLDITAATRIAPKRIRGEFRAIHGSDDPPTGKKPSNPDVIFGAPEAHRQASYYFSCLRAVELVSSSTTSFEPPEAMNSRGFDALIDAYYLCRQQYPAEVRLIDPTKAVSFVRKFYLSQHLDLVSCKECHSPFVVQSAVPGANGCPWCTDRLALLSQCRHCRSPLLTDSDRCSDVECRRKHYSRARSAPTVYRCAAMGG